MQQQYKVQRSLLRALISFLSIDSWFLHANITLSVAIAVRVGVAFVPISKLFIPMNPGIKRVRKLVDPTRVELVTYPCHGHMIPTSPWARFLLYLPLSLMTTLLANFLKLFSVMREEIPLKKFKKEYCPELKL